MEVDVKKNIRDMIHACIRGEDEKIKDLIHPVCAQKASEIIQGVQQAKKTAQSSGEE